MADNPILNEEPTAVDDVRRARAALDRESGGDMHRHIAATNAAFEELRKKLGMKLVTPPPGSTRANAASG
jgi:hypothetical protein